MNERDAAPEKDVSQRDMQDMSDTVSTKDFGGDLDMGADLSSGDILVITRTKDGQTFSFDDFYFGLNVDGSLHVELFVKGSGACPMMNDPTPEETMIFTIDRTGSISGGVTLLDFKGRFETPNPNHPSTIKVDAFTFNDQAPRTLSLTISGQDTHTNSHFQYSGNFRATHCSSLDE